MQFQLQDPHMLCSEPNMFCCDLVAQTFWEANLKDKNNARWVQV